MKTTLKIALAIAVVCLWSTAVFAQAGPTDITIKVRPFQVPDETEPRVNLGDAPTGFGPDSWQGPAAGTGNKTNWHARYLSDGDALSTLFPNEAVTMTVNDLDSISYWTKRPSGSVGSGEDWWLTIYTRPTGSGDASSWYHARYNSNYSTHTAYDAWTQYSTDTGMTFGGMTLAQLQAAAGSDLIEAVTVQTNSGWNGFDGYMDGLEIALTNGSVGHVNFSVPEPASLALVGLGLAAGCVVLRRRRR